jgi:ankyrin repeat protein
MSRKILIDMRVTTMLTNRIVTINRLIALLLLVVSQSVLADTGAALLPELHQAVIAGDRHKVKLLLARGVDPNLRDSVGRPGHHPHIINRTPLHVAAVFGKTNIAEVLLEHGANPNVFDDDSESPLTLAAWKGNLQLIKILVRYGARINYLDPGDYFSRSNTPLYTAVEYGYISIVKYLLSKSANVNLACHNGSLSLHEAALRARFDIVKLLLEHGADVDAVVFDDNTALHETMKNYLSLFEVKDGDLGAMWEAKLKIAKLLLKKGANPRKPRNDGQTPLDLARKIKDVEIRNTMLEILAR